MTEELTQFERTGNPFPGLRPFETEEYNLFFGREGQSDELLARLGRTRFLAVVGTSGSGKSSLIRAGLKPALYGGLMAGTGSAWRIAVMRPGHDPLGNLARALAEDSVLGSPEVEDAVEASIIETTLRRSTLGLADAVRQARLPAGENVLVVADQFEELFRFRAMRDQQGTDDEASAFVKLLLEAPRHRDVSLYVVLTMRSDFLGDCAQFQGLPEAINDGQYLIPRMTRDERRMAITGPALVGGGEISPPLVNRLLNDVGDNPDQLPILQHALMRTWKHWSARRGDSEPVGLADYEAVGTMSGALSKHADEAFNELADERGRHVAEVLFKALTERGADNREVRRPTRLREVCEITGASPAEVAAVVEVFRREGRSFLMPPAGNALEPETVIDISHESLIRNWGRLKEWVKEEAEAARIYRRLADAAAARRAGEGGLLDDVTLGWVNRWRDKYAPNRAWGVRYHPGYDEAMAYLEESRASSDARIAAEGERERRELEQARASANQQARAARRLRWLAAGMALMFMLALAGAGYAFTMKQRADSAKSQTLELYTKLQQTLKEAQLQKENAVRAAEDLKAQKALADKSAQEAHNEQQRADNEAQAAQVAAASARASAAAADTARGAAVANEEQAQAAVARSGLIRQGLEAYQREDYLTAVGHFDSLTKMLAPLRPGAPRPTGAPVGLTPERAAAETGWAYSYEGSAFRQAGLYGHAADSYKEALENLKLLPDGKDRILFDTYHGLGHVYHKIALRGYVNDQYGHAAETKFDQKQYFDSAREYYQKALDFQQQLAAGKPAGKEPEEIAEEHANLGRLNRDVGDLKEAERNFKEAVRVRLVRGFDDAAATALRELAEFYAGQYRWDDAVRAYDRLIDLQEDNYTLERGRDLADSYSDLGLAYNARGDGDKAEKAYRVANLMQQATLTLHTESALIGQGEGPVTLDDRMDELGDAYIQLGRYRQAEQIYPQALNLRLKVKANQEKRRFSYQKLGDLYNDYLKDAAKAQDNFNLLVRFYESWPKAKTDPRERDAYASALDKLGRLYAKDPGTYSRAEERLTAARKIFAELFSLKEDSTLDALIDLYARQNKEAELKQACDRRLMILSRYLNNASERTAPQIARTYVRAAGDVVGVYLSRNQAAWAEAAYAQLFAADAKVRGKLYDPARLAEYASLLEEYKGLLRDSNKPAELAKVEDSIESILTNVGDSLKSIQARRKEQQLIKEQ